MLEIAEYIPQLPAAVKEQDERWDILISRVENLAFKYGGNWTPVPVSSLSPNPAVIEVLQIVEAPVDDKALKLDFSRMGPTFTFDWTASLKLARHHYDFGPICALDIHVNTLPQKNGYLELSGRTFMGSPKNYYGTEEFRSLSAVEQKAHLHAKALQKYSYAIYSDHHIKLLKGLCDLAEEVVYGKPDPDHQF